MSGTLCRPSRRLPIVWGIYGALLTLLVGAATALLSRYLPPVVFKVAAVVWMGVLLVFGGYFWLRYRRMSYTLAGAVLTVRSGVLYHTVRQVPLGGIRYITCLSGPPERLCGVCTLLLFLPGGMVALEGVARAQSAALQARLLACGEAARDG